MIALQRLGFFGTPQFAVPTLDALERAGRKPVVVVSQPSRTAGRGRLRQDPPVAQWAQQHRVPLLQPPRVRRAEFLEELAGYRLDVAIVVAFGQIFPARLLEMPRRGCINLHASLLPRHRGASPIAAAIAAGESSTGCTTMKMEAGLDSGPILLQRGLPIEPLETCGELSERLAVVGAELMLETLDGLERGEIVEQPQDHSLATFAPRLEKESGQIDWSLPAACIHDRIRAATPWPGATTDFRGRPLRVLSSRLGAEGEGSPGVLQGRCDDALVVCAGDGLTVELLRLQRPGRKVLAAGDFANGEQPRPGEPFGAGST